MDVRSAGRREWVALGVALLLTVILGALELRPIRDYYASDKEDWRGVAAYLETRLGEGDVILCDGVRAGQGGDSARTQRGLRYYLDSRHPDDLILKESELSRRMGEIGDNQGEVWTVVFRGWRKLKPEGMKGVTVTDFEDVSIVRAEHPDGTLRENAIFMLEALVSLMPLEEATEALHTALDGIQGQSARDHLAQGNACLEQGELDAAILEYERAIEMDPSLAGAHVHLADVRLEQDRSDEAIEGYRRALELKTDWDEQAWLHMRLANAYRDAGRAEEAIEEYRLVLELEPGHAGATDNLDTLLASLPSAKE